MRKRLTTELTREMYDNSLQKLAKKKDKYQFILRAGNDLHDTLLHIFQIVWDGEDKPEQWRDTKIIQLYKGKGDREEFTSQRHIHLKAEVPKFFGHILMNQVKPILYRNMTKHSRTFLMLYVLILG